MLIRCAVGLCVRRRRDNDGTFQRRLHKWEVATVGNIYPNRGSPTTSSRDTITPNESGFPVFLTEFFVFPPCKHGKRRFPHDSPPTLPQRTGGRKEYGAMSGASDAPATRACLTACIGSHSASTFVTGCGREGKVSVVAWHGDDACGSGGR